MTRRDLCCILLCLLAGALTATAAAWALAFRDITHVGERAAAMRSGVVPDAEGRIWSGEGTPDLVEALRFGAPGAVYLRASAYGPHYDSSPPGFVFSITVSLATRRPDLVPGDLAPRGLRPVLLP